MTWTFENVASKAEVTGELTVEVLDSAKEAGKVDNQAWVKVGVKNDKGEDVFDDEVPTPEDENPVPDPHKTETSPDKGTGDLGGVRPGQEITYEISYWNYKQDAATVNIEDKLDENVEFVKASKDGNPSGGKVTWSFTAEKGEKGTVTLTVKVLESALESNEGPGKVENGKDTLVWIDNDNKYDVETVTNPVTEVKKEEKKVNNTDVKDPVTKVGKGAGNTDLDIYQVVEPEDTITYEITAKNYKSDGAAILITDVLDKDVEFVDASDGGEEKDGVVTWELTGLTEDEVVTVELTVKVKESAKDKGKVANQAGVQVGNYVDGKLKYDPEIPTNEEENPVPNPKKEETKPYQGAGTLGEVNVGDEITYKITYKNYKTTVANVKISDKLDPNVEFVKASDGGAVANGTVTWELKNIAPGKEGSVTLTVKVLPGACKYNGGTGSVVNGGDTTTVQVGEDKAYSVETVENLVPDTPDSEDGPKKEEVTPYKGSGALGEVSVGDKITYQITAKNYKSTSATVEIKDKLDPNVKYISSNRGGRYSNGVVTWKINNVPANTEVSVTLTVEVLEGAKKASNGPGQVVNGGDTTTVKVGDDAEKKTNTVVNSVPDVPTSAKPKKEEVAPYKGTGKLGEVKVGDEITYRITYTNYKSEAADVVIKDKLDPNVQFVSADNGGKFASGVVTWTIKNVPAGKTGSVTVKVKVLEGALKSSGLKVVNGGNTTTVKVGDDPEMTVDTVENSVKTGGNETPKSGVPGTGTGNPKTGDNTPLLTWILILLAAVVAGGAAVVVRRRKRTSGSEK